MEMVSSGANLVLACSTKVRRTMWPSLSTGEEGVVDQMGYKCLVEEGEAGRTTWMSLVG